MLMEFFSKVELEVESDEREDTTLQACIVPSF